MGSERRCGNRVYGLAFLAFTNVSSGLVLAGSATW